MNLISKGVVKDMKERIVFLDYLRVVACFMVMAIHACEPFYLGGEEGLIAQLKASGFRVKAVNR